MPLNTLIRPLVKTDLPRLAEIEAALQAFPWTAQQFEESYADGHRGWVAVQNDIVIGFAVTSQVVDELSLLALGVDSAFQRQGMASQLIEQIIETRYEVGASIMLLEVRKSNVAARALYRRLGFIENGLRKGYYRAVDGREDAVLMALVMDESGR